MALSAGCHIEIRNGGSDTICSGAFDPTQTAGMFTDGAATSANTSAPVFSSASYNFVAGDVGAYVFIGAGTNWTKGWYVIASVASNNATLTATAAGYQAHGDSFNTSAGCASVASPTGATWSIDYSQQDAARNTFTDLTFVTGTTFTSATVVFGKQLVGNVLKITGGTNYTVGSYAITGVTGTTATLNGTACSGASSDGAGSLGGAYASVGSAAAVMVAGNICWVKYHATAYTSTSTSSNVSAGRATFPAGSSTAAVVLWGYNTFRGDNPRGSDRPVFKWGVNAGDAYLLTSGSTFNQFRNFILDGNRANFTSTAAISKNGGSCMMLHCKVMGCSATTIMQFSPNDTHYDCEFTDCTVSIAIGTNAGLFFTRCYFHDFTTSAMTITSGIVACNECIFDSNAGTGITSSGNTSVRFFNCAFYNNTSGISFTGVPFNAQVHNCVFEGNSAYGINCSANYVHLRLWGNAFYNNTSGKYVNVNSYQVVGEIIPTASVFVDPVNADFRLNMKTGGGASLRGASYPSTFPGLTWANRRDIGAHQHSGSSRGING